MIVRKEWVVQLAPGYLRGRDARNVQLFATRSEAIRALDSLNERARYPLARAVPVRVAITLKIKRGRKP